MEAKKSVLKSSIVEFYKLNHHKGLFFTYNHWKKCSLSKATIYRLMERFDKDGHIDQDVIIKMFDELKAKVHIANQDGLFSLLKF